jgi:diamine N-acetyltransferase
MAQADAGHKERPLVNITGELVALGPLRPELNATYARWFNDFATTQALGDIAPPWTAARQDAWYTAEVTTPSLIPFTVYDRATWQPIGTTALLDVDFRHRTAEYGIIIGEAAFRGSGRGTEITRLMVAYALTTLGLHNVLLTVYSFNVAGIRAYTKAGFREIGRQRECYFLAGRWWDRVYMEVMQDTGCGG